MIRAFLRRIIDSILRDPRGQLIRTPGRGPAEWVDHAAEQLMRSYRDGYR